MTFRNVYLKSINPDACKVVLVNLPLDNQAILMVKRGLMEKLNLYGQDIRYGVSVKAILEPFDVNGVFVSQDKPIHWFDLEGNLPSHLGTEENPIWFSEQEDKLELIRSELSRINSKISMFLQDRQDKIDRRTYTCCK